MRKRRQTGYHAAWTWRARVLLLLILMVVGMTLVLLRMRPLLFTYGANVVQYTATSAINQTLENKIYQQRADYENLVTLERDADNRVTAVKTDSISINRMKTQISQTVYEEINTLENAKLHIPLGTIIAPSICSGMGPNVTVGMAGLGGVETNFISAFTQAGINQTRHNIILEVRVPVDVLTAFGSRTTTVETQFTVTDTVIVGTVPEQYTYINVGDGSLLGTISDYANSATDSAKTAK